MCENFENTYIPMMSTCCSCASPMPKVVELLNCLHLYIYIYIERERERLVNLIKVYEAKYIVENEHKRCDWPLM